MRFPVLKRMPNAVLVLLLPAMLTVAASPAQLAPPPSPNPLPLTRTSTADFSLKWRLDRRKEASALRKAVNKNGAQVSVAAMLKTARFTAKRKCSGAKATGGALHDVARLADWYCLNKKDSSTKAWTPQGVSGTEDAYGKGGTVNGNTKGDPAIVFSWHAGAVGKSKEGARLTFLDTRTKKYEHVLLVRPDKKGSYGDVTTHAGGIAWYHHYIFVVGVRSGVSVYDVNDLLDLATSPHGDTHDKKKIGLHGGTYYGHGYHYLLPEIGQWHNQHTEVARYDYIALASNRNFTLTGEFCEEQSSCHKRGRVVRWRTQALLGFGAGKVIKPVEALLQPDPYIQGGFRLTRAGMKSACYYFNMGRGSYAGPTHYLITAAIKNATKKGAKGEKPHWLEGGRGLQDLYWLRSADQLWTVTERRNTSTQVRRVLYGISRPPFKPC